MRTTTRGSRMQFMIILMCHWKNAGFSKQDHNSLIKGCRQWKEITLSHCITYLRFKYEKLSHEERHINSASDEKGRIKISILSFVIDSLSGRASLFAGSLHANEAHCAVLSSVSSLGKGALITADAAEGKAKEKTSRGQGGSLNWTLLWFESEEESNTDDSLEADMEDKNVCTTYFYSKF